MFTISLFILIAVISLLSFGIGYFVCRNTIKCIASNICTKEQMNYIFGEVTVINDEKWENNE